MQVPAEAIKGGQAPEVIASCERQMGAGSQNACPLQVQKELPEANPSFLPCSVSPVKGLNKPFL